MASISPALLAVALACVAAAAGIVLLVAGRVRATTEEAQRSVGLLSAALERALRAIRTVKISRAEAREEAEISGAARAAYEAGVRTAAYEALVGPATNVVLQGSFVLVLGVGGAMLAAGTLSLEELVSFLLYLLYLVMPLVLVFVSFTELQQGLAAVSRVKEVLALPEEDATSPHPGQIPARRPEDTAGANANGANANGANAEGANAEGADVPAARFDRVTFGYAPGRPVLREVSFGIRAPGLTALVGPSGAGKSTVFALLERFYDPDSGTVELNGEDARALPLNELRRRVACVEQDSPVMAGTLRENLLYARPDAPAADLEEAIDLAGLHAFVAGLPEGLDTEVGDGGVLLSGGERQRVATARMLLLRPRLLLLDEVTSQLDARNERALRGVFSAVSRRCAVVVIAHRLSTVQDADRIIVLDGGRVRAGGRHEDLMASDALYRDLVRTQLIDGGGVGSGPA